jgi:formylglycine-generating enzyme required for sulfatase activity
LLRAMRRIITQAADASLEADFWQDPRLASPHVQGATPQADRLPDFRELTIEDRRRALAVIRQWRQPLPAEIWISEIWGLDAGSEATLPADDREDAQRWQATLAAHESGEFSDALIAWLARTTENTPRHAMQRHRILRVLHRRIHGTNELLGGDLRELPPGPVIDVAVAQMGGSLVCCLSSSRPADSHWHSLGLLRSRTASVIVSGAKSEDRNSFWKSGRPPGWARDWGRDKFGAWVTFQIESPSLLQSEDSDNLLDEDGNALPDESPQFVTQRLRWIPAGTFLMGSPESEAGRWPDERPQHEVTLTRGFWMFDTPVTQQLWRAVMGDNPSQFNGDLRPVEKVSWDDTQRFLKALNQKLGDAVFVLPSEAQWEHACRAGTNTAYAFGDDAAKLDDFAWYRDNSAGKTHPVATKQPNAWGLFDMHGNVLEWCQDFWTGN